MSTYELHVIDKGIPTVGLLAQVLVAKCGAQLQPLVQALANELRRHAVLHSDETPVAMLKPEQWQDAPGLHVVVLHTSSNPMTAVVFEFSETRSGENVREFLRLDTPTAWKGTLVTDGFSGYRGCVDMGVTWAQCMAHARRKLYELWVNHGSEVGRQVLRFTKPCSASNARSRPARPSNVVGRRVRRAVAAAGAGALAHELSRHGVLHADKTPVAMLKPGNGQKRTGSTFGRTARPAATRSSNPVKAVVLEFSETRRGEHAGGRRVQRLPRLRGHGRDVRSMHVARTQEVPRGLWVNHVS